jgi:hypothetical protein
MSDQTFPIVAGHKGSNELLKRILYALMNNGAIGIVPGHHGDNELLKGILYQLQNGAAGGGSGGPGNGQALTVYDPVSMTWRPITAPNGVVSVT